MLFNIIEEHLKCISNELEYYTTLIKKITIAILIDKESVLNTQILNVINLLHDKIHLFQLYIFINNTK